MRRALKWLMILGGLAGLAAVFILPALAWLQQRAVPRYLTAPVSRGRVAGRRD